MSEKRVKIRNKVNVLRDCSSLWFVSVMRNVITEEVMVLKQALELFSSITVRLDAEHTCYGKANELTN